MANHNKPHPPSTPRAFPAGVPMMASHKKENISLVTNRSPRSRSALHYKLLRTVPPCATKRTLALQAHHHANPIAHPLRLPCRSPDGDKPL